MKLHQSLTILLIVNIIFGVIHVIAHLLEDIMINPLWEDITIIFAQIIFPVTLIINKNNVNKFLYFTTLIGSVWIFIYSTLFHFIVDTLDNIQYTNFTRTGIFFDITTTFLVISQTLLTYNFISHSSHYWNEL